MSNLCKLCEIKSNSKELLPAIVWSNAHLLATKILGFFIILTFFNSRSFIILGSPSSISGSSSSSPCLLRQFLGLLRHPRVSFISFCISFIIPVSPSSVSVSPSLFPCLLRHSQFFFVILVSSSSFPVLLRYPCVFFVILGSNSSSSFPPPFFLSSFPHLFIFVIPAKAGIQYST